MIYKTREEELEILRSDDDEYFSTKTYLDPLIHNALGHFELDEEARGKLYAAIRGDIPLAAKRYLESKSSVEEDRFSVYFTWYIAQRINAVNPQRKAAQS
jgi:hypothetical protein